MNKITPETQKGPPSRINNDIRNGNIFDDQLLSNSIFKLDTEEKQLDTAKGACFTKEGKFDRWVGAKSPNSSVTIIDKANATQGVVLKNNASDFNGLDITVKQFLKRAQRVYAEGGDAKLGVYYAHAQDNKRKKLGGSEISNYQGMSTKDFDVSHKDKKYQAWNTHRGNTYNDLSKLNMLDNANYAIIAVADLLQGISSDPTNGATQWRGHDVEETTTLDGKTVNYKTKWESEMEKAKTDRSVLKDYGLPAGGIVENYMILENKGRYQLFFKFK